MATKTFFLLPIFAILVNLQDIFKIIKWGGYGTQMVRSQWQDADIVYMGQFNLITFEN